MSANGIYDTNDPLSYVSPVRREWAASQVDELWDRWRAVEVKSQKRHSKGSVGSRIIGRGGWVGSMK